MIPAATSQYLSHLCRLTDLSVTPSKFRAKYFSCRVENNFFEDDILEMRSSDFHEKIENVEKLLNRFLLLPLLFPYQSDAKTGIFTGFESPMF
jgi:hypothetical protein